jgi:4-carboxymuconolactone decarboxylase
MSDDIDTGRARLMPLREWDPDYLAFIRRASLFEGDPLNFFYGLAYAPAMATKWTRFAAHLLGRGVLPARDRELLILRTVWNCSAEYEFVHHAAIGADAGLSDADITALQEGPSGAQWTDRERALLQAADELHHDAVISDATWASLGAEYDQAALLEICMVVGNYHLVSFYVRSFAIPLEPGVEP